MSIIIGADIVPTQTNVSIFENGDVEELIGKDLEMLLKNADFRIFNLEVPLSDEETPIKKQGPNLIAPRQSIIGIKKMGIDLFTLANNHIMDQGEKGLYSTIELLKNHGISFFGAGKNIDEARAPFYFTAKGKRYGVYSCVEHEFSIAEEEKPGANPFDSLVAFDHIQQMAPLCDYIIVLYHGGKECYRYPSPQLQRICRRFVDKGANLIICQHSHCIGCKEEYKKGTIIYGQGNFLFDDVENDYWKTGILIRIEETGSVNYIPITKNGNGVRIAPSEVGKEIISAFDKRSEEIKEESFIEKKYIEFAIEYRNNYILELTGKSKNLPFRIINKFLWHKLENKYAKRYLMKYALGVRNYIECEAHRELLLKALEFYDL